METRKHILLFIFILFLFIKGWGQASFSFSKGIVEEKIPVEIISNLVVIPVTVNGIDLNFLLDTGANGTIIFEIKENQEILANNAVFIDLKGAGTGAPIKALKSHGNTIKIGQTVSNDQEMYVIIDEQHNFSPRLGYEIHGIIGYDFFKDFIVKINYTKKYIIVSTPQSYSYDTCKKCETFPLDFIKNRPYIYTDIKTNNDSFTTKMLLDSGASDPLWLFENSLPSIKVPENNFNDFLGVGLNGTIEGKRAYTESLTLGRFNFKKVTTAFPDSISIKNIIKNNNRNGSIGAGFLYRFHCIIDYPNKKITLSQNRNYDKPFSYNKSGLLVQHGDYTINKELLSSNDKSITRANEYTNQVVNIFKTHNKYKTKLLPTYVVSQIREGSMAEKAGVQKGDLIIAINNKNTERMKLEDVNKYFFQEDGKTIHLKIERNGIPSKISFVLTSIL